MVAHYPIRVKRKSYKGMDIKKRKKADDRDRIATELEIHLNKLISKQTQELAAYYYHDIAQDTGYPEKIVKEILFSVDCGSTGLTAHKPEGN